MSTGRYELVEHALAPLTQRGAVGHIVYDPAYAAQRLSTLVDLALDLLPLDLFGVFIEQRHEAWVVQRGEDEGFVLLILVKRLLRPFTELDIGVVEEGRTGDDPYGRKTPPIMIRDGREDRARLARPGPTGYEATHRNGC